MDQRHGRERCVHPEPKRDAKRAQGVENESYETRNRLEQIYVRQEEFFPTRQVFW